MNIHDKLSCDITRYYTNYQVQWQATDLVRLKIWAQTRSQLRVLIQLRGQLQNSLEMELKQ